MAKKNLTWVICQGFLHGFTPKTHKLVIVIDLFADLGDISDISQQIDNHRQISAGFLHDDPVYDWFWQKLEEFSEVRRTKQLMQLMLDWFYAAMKAKETDIDVGTTENIQIAYALERAL
jgi:hypothetical protein